METVPSYWREALVDLLGLKERISDDIGLIGLVKTPDRGWCAYHVEYPDDGSMALGEDYPPPMLDIVHRLCMQLASAGIAAKKGSHNPIEALHADALAAYAAATGDGNPFGTAMAEVCEANRAALAPTTPRSEDGGGKET